jgi:hypothetical protein
MNIKEEFEAAYQSWAKEHAGLDPCIETAEWAARWMAEKCADKVLLSDLTKMALAGEIRQLAQELTNDLPRP